MHKSVQISSSKMIKKKGFKNNILENYFKDTTIYEKPLRITQKQIKSSNLLMTMEDVEKDVIPVHSNKRELVLQLNIPWEYRGKKYQLLLSTFRINETSSRKTIQKLLKVYPKDIFNLDYLQQYWLFDEE